MGMLTVRAQVGAAGRVTGRAFHYLICGGVAKV